MKLIKSHPKSFILFIFVLLFLTFIFSLLKGNIEVSAYELYRGLFVEYDDNVASIYTIRFPRVIVIMLVGAGLALSGLIFQVVLKNPLADPGLLGISNGASLVSLVLSIFFVELYSIIPILSFLGGVFVFVLIYSLTFKSSFNATRIILIGVAINFTLTAIIEIIQGSSKSIASAAMGTMSLYTWDDVKLLLIYLLPMMLIALLMAKVCNLLGLEDNTLVSLGVNVQLYRFVLAVVAVLLCSIGVSVAGVISFIGLIVPHFARIIIGNDHKYLLPLSFLLGALVLLVADTLGRLVLAPFEIAPSIIMAVLGGPLFILLLKRSVDVNGN